MYSILVKNSEKSYTYYLNPDGTVFSGDSEATITKFNELLETYSLGKLKIVHNVNLTADFVIEDAI